MSKTIYKSSCYKSFSQKDNKFFYEEEAHLIGYGMGAHAVTTDKLEITEEEFKNKKVYIETILLNDVSQELLIKVQTSLRYQKNVPTYLESDDFKYDHKRNLPIYPKYKGKKICCVYNYGFVESKGKTIYWQVQDNEKKKITYYKQFDSESDARKEAIRWMLKEYYDNVPYKLEAEKENIKVEFNNGLKDGIPIALGYLAVSFSMGIMAVSSGLSVFQGAVISFTNVTSAGQFAGLKIIAASGTILEMIFTQLIINLRYALMSLSMSQKLSHKVNLWQRFVIAFANTDEIFAVAMAHRKSLTFPYMIGLQSLPVIGWTAGTILGGISGNLMSHTLQVATGVALYGMFIAIVIPAARKSKPVLFTACTAVVISSVLYYVPLFSHVSQGISIIISTIISAGLSAALFPIADEQVLEESELSREEDIIEL